MGLLTNWGAANKVITQSKTVTYSHRRLFGQNLVWNVGLVPYVYNICESYQRTCKMQFEYVGMSLETAERCVEYLQSVFSRNVYTSQWSSSQGEFTTVLSGKFPMTDISISKMEGHMYKVIVSVNEKDTRQWITPPSSTEGMFAFENNREYLEDEEEWHNDPDEEE